jgi:hypothetical protein
MSCAASAASPQAASPHPRPLSSTPSRSRPPSRSPAPAAGTTRVRRSTNGRKRHIAVDTIGLLLTLLTLLTLLITAASVQDRDAAKPLLWNLTKAFPAIRAA